MRWQALLELGADPLHRNTHEKTALDLLGQGGGTVWGGARPVSNESTPEDRRALKQLVERWVAEKAAHTSPGLVLAMRVGCGMPECTGPIQLPSVHAHDLARSHRTHEWRCDGCTAPGQGNR